MLLDSDILIDLLRRHPPALSWFAALPSVPPTTGIAVLELAFGCQSGSDLNALRRFLVPFPVIWPVQEDFQLAYSDYAQLRLSTGLGLLDAVTAAVARRSGEDLVTFNARHFRAVPGLATLQPYAR